MACIWLLTAVVLCLLVSVCGSVVSDVIAPSDMPLLFSGDLSKPKDRSNRRRHRTVPSYMRQLYKRQNPKTPFSQVSCFFSQDSNPSFGRGHLLTFDLSSVALLSSVSRVTLRVFKRRPKRTAFKDMFQVHLFQVFLSDNGNSSVEDKMIVSSRVVNNWRGEWLAFDVTSQLRKVSRRSIASFFLNIQRTSSTQVRAEPVTIGKSGRKRSILLVFYPKAVSKVKEKQIKLPKLGLFKFGLSRFQRDSSRGARRFCRRRYLYVDFKTLGWDSRIIAPRGYPAYFCRGKCSVLLGQSLNESPYSVIRYLYKTLGKEYGIPSACCVPTELKSTSILYFDENDNIVLKEFPDMSVASCGCR